MKIHIEATEAPHCTFSSRARRKLPVFYGFLYSSKIYSASSLVVPLFGFLQLQNILHVKLLL